MKEKGQVLSLTFIPQRFTGCLPDCTAIMLTLVTEPQARPSPALQELQAGDGPHHQSVPGDPPPKYRPSFQDETCSGCFAKVPISRQGKLRPRQDEQIGKAKRQPGADGEVN